MSERHVSAVSLLPKKTADQHSHVRRGAAHVEPDDGNLPLLVPTGERVADNATCRTRKDRSQARKLGDGNEGAFRGHELDAGLGSALTERVFKAFEETLEVRAKDRVQVRIRRS